MTIRNPVPQAPREDMPSADWDRWLNLVNRNSIQLHDFDVVIDPSSIAANTTAEQDVTVSGLAENDLILSLTKPTLTAGIGVVNTRVKTADTLSITFLNTTGGAIDPPPETYKLVVIRQ